MIFRNFQVLAYIKYGFMYINMKRIEYNLRIHNNTQGLWTNNTTLTPLDFTRSS